MKEEGGRLESLKQAKSAQSLSTLTGEVSDRIPLTSSDQTGSSSSDDNEQIAHHPKRIKRVESNNEIPSSPSSAELESSEERRSSSPPIIKTTTITNKDLNLEQKNSFSQKSACSRNTISSLKSSAPLRKGKWTMEEEMYTSAIIREFERGMLNCAPGTTLRSFLSDKLHCDPMRITKKFAGDASIGKRVFTPCKHTPDTVAEMARVQAELEAIETRFMSHLQRSPGSNTTSSTYTKSRGGSTTRGSSRHDSLHLSTAANNNNNHHHHHHPKAGLLLHPGLRTRASPTTSNITQQQYDLLYSGRGATNFKALASTSRQDNDAPVLIDHTGQVVMTRERIDAYGRPIYLPVQQGGQNIGVNKAIVVPGPAGQLAIHDLASPCFMQSPSHYLPSSQAQRNYMRTDLSEQPMPLYQQQSSSSPTPKRKRKENQFLQDAHSPELSSRRRSSDSELAAKEADSRLLLDFFVSVHQRTSSPNQKKSYTTENGDDASLSPQSRRQRPVEKGTHDATTAR